MTTTEQPGRQIAERSLRIMVDGTRVDFVDVIRPEAVNREATQEPPAFPPTGRTFAVTRTHWLPIAYGRVTEHWANRDDLGTGAPLGWTPPSPRYLLRLALATRRARRAAQR